MPARKAMSPNRSMMNVRNELRVREWAGAFKRRVIALVGCSSQVVVRIGHRMKENT